MEKIKNKKRYQMSPWKLALYYSEAKKLEEHLKVKGFDTSKPINYVDDVNGKWHFEQKTTQ